MIVVLLLVAWLVLGGLIVGAYVLFFRSDSSGEAGEPRPAVTSSGNATAPPDDTAPGGGGGSASSSVEGPESTAKLESTARDYVDAVNDRDEAAATELTCERENPGTLYSVTEGREVRLVRVKVLAGAVGSADIRVGDGATALLMEKQEDGWCVAI